VTIWNVIGQLGALAALVRLVCHINQMRQCSVPQRVIHVAVLLSTAAFVELLAPFFGHSHSAMEALLLALLGAYLWTCRRSPVTCPA
jgi:hypothetical protein